MVERFKWYRVFVVFVLIGLLCFGLAAVVSGTEGNPSPSGEETVGAIAGPFEHTRSVEDNYDIWSFYPVQRQVFSEGCLDYGFETWLTLYNASEETADYSILVSGPAGYSISFPEEITAHQRLTFNLNQFNRPNTYALGNPLNISVEVYMTSESVHAQESMYWDNRDSGHTSVGVTEKL